MTQEIITYIIVFTATIVAVYNIIKIFKGKQPDCGCGKGKKCKKKHQ